MANNGNKSVDVPVTKVSKEPNGRSSLTDPRMYAGQFEKDASCLECLWTRPSSELSSVYFPLSFFQLR